MERNDGLGRCGSGGFGKGGGYGGRKTSGGTDRKLMELDTVHSHPITISHFYSMPASLYNVLCMTFYSIELLYHNSVTIQSCEVPYAETGA